MGARKVGLMRRHLKVWMAASDNRRLVSMVKMSSEMFERAEGSSVKMG
jgi:hypothetical protein